MSLRFKLKWRAGSSDGTEQLVAMLLPSKSFLSRRDVCSRVVWGELETIQSPLQADGSLWTYAQTTSLSVHSDFESRQERMNFSAPCLPNLARDHITWGLERKWLAPHQT